MHVRGSSRPRRRSTFSVDKFVGKAQKRLFTLALHERGEKIGKFRQHIEKIEVKRESIP